MNQQLANAGVKMTTEIKDDYLGDGVYASFDGYHVGLDLRGQDSTTRIGLEPPVMERLIEYYQKTQGGNYHIQGLIGVLDNWEGVLCELIQDEQGKAEEAAGVPIVVPEDAAPELDDVRGHLRDALGLLRGLIR